MTYWMVKLMLAVNMKKAVAAKLDWYNKVEIKRKKKKLFMAHSSIIKIHLKK